MELRYCGAKQANGFAKYIIHFRTYTLWDALPELANKTLACDCAMDQMC